MLPRASGRRNEIENSARPRVRPPAGTTSVAWAYSAVKATTCPDMYTMVTTKIMAPNVSIVEKDKSAMALIDPPTATT